MAHGSGVQYGLSGAQLFSGRWISGQARDPQNTLVLRIEFKSVTRHFCELRSALKRYYNELDAQNRERINRWCEEHFHHNAITILGPRNADYFFLLFPTFSYFFLPFPTFSLEITKIQKNTLVRGGGVDYLVNNTLGRLTGE